MSRPRPFAQVDVFSRTPYRGNPVAVFLDGEGLGPSEMQAVARWTNLSETTFVVPAASEQADYGLRIFTPGGELPFAGHPTLGSAHAWLEHGGTPRDPNLIVQEVPAGLIPIRRRDGILSFQAPETRRTGPLDDELVDALTTAFGIPRTAVLSHQWVDNGPGWAVVRLATAQDVLDLTPDLSTIPDAMVGVIGAYPDGSDHAFEMRTFAPRFGVTEDPICGSMNASVGQWLARTGEVSGTYRVSQGSKLGRAGDITVTLDDDGDVWVGGATTTIVRGTALA